jgi:hypothetical protein
MVNALSPNSATVRCRQIVETDLVAIADLLTHGFPGRKVSYWMRGLTRMAAAEVPPGCPRFGCLIENQGRPVGVVLLLYHALEDATGARRLRCNLSSWYVEPAFRSYAPLLILYALKQRNVTFINLSPAPQTWRTVEVQGFKCFSMGHFVSIPAVSPNGAGTQVVPFPSSDKTGLNLTASELTLLADHARLGCICVTCQTPKGDLPFVFVPFSIRAGRIKLPIVRLVYCRDVEDFVACAAALGRHLLRHGIVSVMLDANGPVKGLMGVYTEKLGRKYFKGPTPPRLGDLAYSELVVFGP